MTNEVLMAADEGREVGVMFIADRGAGQALECYWVLSDMGLACIWIERRLAAGVLECVQDVLEAEDRRVA